MLMLPSIFRHFVCINRLRYDIRIFLVTVTLSATGVMLRNRATSCEYWKMRSYRNRKQIDLCLPPLSLNVGPLTEPRWSQLLPFRFLLCFRLSLLLLCWSLSTNITTNAMIRSAEMTPTKTLIIGVNRKPIRWLSEKNTKRIRSENQK